MSNRILPTVTVALVFLSAASSHGDLQAAEPTASVISQVDPQKHRVAGQWRKQGTELIVAASTGARLILPVKLPDEYDFRVSFTRRSGQHSIALIFPSSNGQGTFEIDAWGAHLAGIQNVNGQSIRDNATRTENVRLENGRRYTAQLKVRRDRVDASLDGKSLVTLRTDGANLSVLDAWQIPDATALGLGAWDSETVFHSVEVLQVDGKSMTLAANSTPGATPGPSRPRSSTPRPESPVTTTPSVPARPAGTQSGHQNRVLIVIANQDFFYREYGDPREELERAGIEVEVAAGRLAPCRPHGNSGQGSDGGVVTPDLTLADVDVSRYDAILFSGGWGSSMYQYAFEGSYNNRVYNGERAVKQITNRLINEFVTQDKYVCALCHGTSILAWSRIGGRSLLAGRQATGPTRQGPSGVYNGRQSQPPSRWNLEVNGARVVAPNAIGNRNTAADDIVADGKILTGQDDISAREMGRQIAARVRSASRDSR